MSVALLTLLTLVASGPEHEAPPPAPAAEAARSVHPDVVLRGADAQPVLQTGAPISLTKTCGECHEADWIEAHSYHSAFGSNRPYTDEDRPRPWDRFAGPWGRWSPSCTSACRSRVTRVRTPTSPPGRACGAAATWAAGRCASSRPRRR